MSRPPPRTTRTAPPFPYTTPFRVRSLGAGVGLTMCPSTAAITSSLPDEKQGVAASLNDTVRELGAAVGIALIGSVLNAAYRTNVEAAAAGLPTDAAEAVEDGIGGALVVAGQLGPDVVALVDAARGAFVAGMTDRKSTRLNSTH